jgi:hypothetical protein
MKLYLRLKVNNKWIYRAVTDEEYNKLRNYKFLKSLKMLDDVNEL